MKKKLYTRSEIMPEQEKDQALVARYTGRKGKRDTDLLNRCRQAWEALRPMRETRERVMNYCYGDQWGDVMEYDGGKITEREYLYRTNTTPLVNNIMSSILNSLVGLYAKQGTEPVCFARTRDAQWLSDMMSATMQQNWQETRMQDVLKHAFEDYCVGGVAVSRETYEDRDGNVPEAWTDVINPYYPFWESNYDVRMTDMSLIGTLNDVTPEELLKQFARKEMGWTKKNLENLYGLTADGEPMAYRRYGGDSWQEQNTKHKLDNVMFDTPSDVRKLRVIEVWYKDTKERYQCFDPLAVNMDEKYFRCEKADIGDIKQINIERKKLYDEAGVKKEERPYVTAELIQDTFWKYCYMTPDGTILCEGESPYDFKGHPFTIKLYPYVNGEIHPYMGNIVDQQRYINRLIVMHDMAARSAAKGVTIVPITAIPDGMTPQEFGDQFTAYDGMVFYNPSRMNPNLRPEIITSNAVQIGVPELLNLQMSLIRDISNVSGALQGKAPSAGTSASRYAQETQNATTSLFAILVDFTNFTEELSNKKCQIIKQFYEQGRLVFNKDNTGMIEYDRLGAQDVKFKISIKESAATAAYQSQMNEFLMQLFQMGAIGLKQVLQNSTLPYADKLLQDIESEQATMMQQQQMAAEAQQMEQADEGKVQKAQQMLRGR